MSQITIVLDDTASMRRALTVLAQATREERDYFDGEGGAHGATAEALERIAIQIERASA